MEIRYKLTNEHMQTHAGCQWTLNEWKETTGKGDLCSAGWLHVYSDPLVAAFMNPIHAMFTNPRLFKAEVDGKSKDDKGRKEGWTRVRLVKELDMPKPTLEQWIRFGILYAMKVCEDKKWRQWAEDWLSGKDRSRESASDAASSAASRVASRTASRAASFAASYATSRATSAASYAASYAASASDIDLIAIAKEAMKG